MEPESSHRIHKCPPPVPELKTAHLKLSECVFNFQYNCSSLSYKTIHNVLILSVKRVVFQIWIGETLVQIGTYSLPILNKIFTRFLNISPTPAKQTLVQ